MLNSFTRKSTCTVGGMSKMSSSHQEKPMRTFYHTYETLSTGLLFLYSLVTLVITSLGTYVNIRRLLSNVAGAGTERLVNSTFLFSHLLCPLSAPKLTWCSCPSYRVREVGPTSKYQA